MKTTLIAAVAEDRIMGSSEGGIPWDLPRDKKHFREYTAEKWLLVGRKTYEEMSGWFQSRTPIVLSRDKTFETESPWHQKVGSVPEAIALTQSSGIRELVVIGGASVYAAAMPFADRLVLTFIRAAFSVDSALRFPEFDDQNEWRRSYRETWQTDQENRFSMNLEIFERIG